jgi:hypothetical protein
MPIASISCESSFGLIKEPGASKPRFLFLKISVCATGDHQNGHPQGDQHTEGHHPTGINTSHFVSGLNRKTGLHGEPFFGAEIERAV